MSLDPNEESSLIEHLAPLDDRPGPAPRIGNQRALDLVNAAIEDWELEGADPRSGSAAPPRPPRAGRWVKLSAAGVVTIAGVAAAAVHFAPRPDEMPQGGVVDAPARGIRPAPPAATAFVPEAPAPAPDEAAKERGAAVEPPRVPATPEARTPDDFLRQGNQLRAEGRFRDAERAYSRVFRAAPRSASAYVARVAAASLRLEKLRDPAGARRLFRAAGFSGALDVEVRSGIARASRLLSDRAGEIEALSGLVAAHPGTPAAERARQRLAALEAD